jgi:hypothetical protein
VSNKKKAALNGLSPEPEVTWSTAAILIRVPSISPCLCNSGVALSLSYIHYNQSSRVFTTTRTDFNENWYLCIFRKSVEKIIVSVKSEINNGYFTWSPIYIFDYILLNSS